MKENSEKAIESCLKLHFWLKALRVIRESCMDFYFYIQTQVSSTLG